MIMCAASHIIELKRAFTLAGTSRSVTPAVIVSFEHEGIVGFGEAALPPYLGETHQSVFEFISQHAIRSALEQFCSSRDMTACHDLIDKAAAGNAAAKAALDIALHDWSGKAGSWNLCNHWGLVRGHIAVSSYTISIADPETVRRDVLAASEWHALKVKLGRDNDKEIVTAIREISEKPLRVDVNQGWSDADTALRMAEWLAERNVEFIEQPFATTMIDQTAWLRERSPIPILADESAQRLSDVKKLPGIFDGINIKLMKCTGLLEAREMIGQARELGLKVMLGCMTETSCAISAAAQISPLADWVDLDGAALTRNDPFTGARLLDGKIMPPEQPGIGADPVPGALRFTRII